MQLKLSIVLYISILHSISTNNTAPNLSKVKSTNQNHLNNFNKTLTKNFSWYFYRSDHLISDSSEFRDTRTFDGFNIYHFHKNSSGFFRTYSKCPKTFSINSLTTVHISISKF